MKVECEICPGRHCRNTKDGNKMVTENSTTVRETDPIQDCLILRGLADSVIMDLNGVDVTVRRKEENGRM